ncbi:gag-pol polyprotein [Cucumis melo var. makuwa]|uniref:Gag-pol polyprotein n=1 Tax=Cucumis melo var. makuwa TaxID=1194695 RepID=A0A5A7SMC2_CUCMM|nr:gag-pol polyprotein [Cucumis melo var. makuwa]
MEIIREGPSVSRSPMLDGTTKVKISRLQLVTSKFEALKMSEEETVADYNERVFEISNESFNLGERIPETKIVYKVLQSLPDDKKEKGVAFKTVCEEETPDHKTTNEANINEFIALLTKQFSKFVKKFRNMNTTGAGDREQNSFCRRDENFKRKLEGRTFKCRECGDIGHYQAECPTYMRSQKKSFCATLFEVESDYSEEEDECTNAFINSLTEHDVMI